MGRPMEQKNSNTSNTQEGLDASAKAALKNFITTVWKMRHAEKESEKHPFDFSLVVLRDKYQQEVDDFLKVIVRDRTQM